MVTRRIPEFHSSFLSVEKDLETILRKLFVDSRPYSDQLKRLLVINNPDCLTTTNEDYNQLIAQTGLSKLMDEGYVRIKPKIDFGLHETVKSYIVVEFNNFSPNAASSDYRDCVIDFNIICHTDHWELGDYKLRPIKIIGYIDGLLNQSKLSGIGTLNFMGANEVVLDENLSGYLLRYAAIHGTDDKIPVGE